MRKYIAGLLLSLIAYSASATSWFPITSNNVVGTITTNQRQHVVVDPNFHDGDIVAISVINSGCNAPMVLQYAVVSNQPPNPATGDPGGLRLNVTFGGSASCIGTYTYGFHILTPY